MPSSSAILALLFFLSISGCWEDLIPPKPERIDIGGNWTIQASNKAGAHGEEISLPGFDDSSWYITSVPSTVMAALADNGKYPDPYFGMNMLTIQTGGFSVSSFSAFSDWLNLLLDSWWYRTEFILGKEYSGSRVFLNLDGINYRANIFMNGRLIAGKSEVCGTYRRFSFDVTGIAVAGKRNAVAVQVFRPADKELALTWVDWAPTPPDENMGLWHGVYLKTCGDVRISDMHVSTELASNDKAFIRIRANLQNLGRSDIKGRLVCRIDGVSVSSKVNLSPGEKREMLLDETSHTELVFNNPRIWMPAHLGEQHLYTMEADIEADGSVSDRSKVKFGIRKITSELTEKGHRLFRINGNPILIKAAGWASDLMLRYSPQREEAEIKYVRDLNLNAIRLEGNLATDSMLELCDMYGIMVIAGWCCCSHWEDWNSWDDEDYRVATASLDDQIKRLRNHPSLIAWLNGSDFHPPVEIEEMYLDIISKYRWPNPVIAAATAEPSEVTGPTGLKMTGPYEWVPPVYWYEDTERGGAFGFNTETSPGPAVPEMESLLKMLPEDHLWPIDIFWLYHCGRGQFWNLSVVTKAMDERYGKSGSVEEYSMKAQVSSYEAQRAMFEAFRRNKYDSTGVVQWMLGNPWPSMIWHLYDYYLRPGGGYFGTKKACEPLHIQYSYDDRSVVVVNDYYQLQPSFNASAMVYDISGRLIAKKDAMLDIPSDSRTRVFTIDEPQGLGMYFLRLELKDIQNKLISRNDYWLSSKPDVLDYKRTRWWYTPAKSFADLTLLNGLPDVELKASWKTSSSENEMTGTADIENQSGSVAFMIRLRAVSPSTGEELLPVLWDDNYLTLMPGEKRTLRAVMNIGNLSGSTPLLEIRGWNVTKSVD